MWIKRIILTAGFIILCLGLMVDYGWLTGKAGLIQILPTLVPMQFNTALGFVLTGLGILAYQNKRISLIFGGSLLVLFVITLLQDVLSKSFGIDELFISAYITTNSIYPGRPAPNTSMCFLLIALALIGNTISNKPIRGLITVSLSFVVTVLGSIALLGYLLGIEAAYGWGVWTQMAVHTAAGMLLSGMTLTIISISENYEIAFHKNRIIPLCVFVSCLTVTLYVSNIFLTQEDKKIQLETEKYLNAKLALIQAQVSYELDKIRNVYYQLKYRHGYKTDGWQQSAERLIENDKYVKSMAIFSQSNELEKLVTTNALKNEGGVLAKACLTNNFSNDQIVVLQNAQLICLSLEFKNQGKINTFITALDLKKLFISNIEDANKYYDIQVSYLNGEIFSDNEHINIKDQLGYAAPINILGKTFIVTIWPTEALVEYYRVNYSLLIMISGVVISILFLILIWVVQDLFISRLRSEFDKRRLRTVVDNSPFAIMMFDKCGKLIFYNKKSDEMFELDGENKLISDYIKEDIELCNGSGKLNIPKLRVATGIGKFNQCFPIDIKFNAVETKSGKAIMCVAQDISELVTQKNKSDELNSKLQVILNSSHVSIIATDLHGTITHFNKAAEKILEYTKEDMIGKETPLAFHDMKEVEKQFKKLRKKYGDEVEGLFDAFVFELKYKDAIEKEWTYISKSGQRKTVLLSVTELRNNDNELYGYLGVAIDISERKEIERLKEEFISLVSHELRTPITAIQGAIMMLSDEMLSMNCSNQTTELLNMAYRNTDRLIRFLNNVLDFEKIKSSNFKYDMKEINIASLIKEAVKLNSIYAVQYEVNIKNNCDDMKHIYSKLDADRFIQVMTNLLSNAIKHSPKNGEVCVSVKVDGDLVSVAVTDKGEGIPDEFKSQLFEKFTQAENTKVRKYQGTGLGLTISKLMVEDMGGTISYESQTGIGTTFFITFPCVEKKHISAGSNDNVFKINKSLTIFGDNEHFVELIKMVLSSTYVTHSASLEHSKLIDADIDVAIVVGSDKEKISHTVNSLRKHKLPIIYIAQESLEDNISCMVDAVILHEEFTLQKLTKTVNKVLNQQSIEEVES